MKNRYLNMLTTSKSNKSNFFSKSVNFKKIEIPVNDIVDIHVHVHVECKILG